MKAVAKINVGADEKHCLTSQWPYNIVLQFYITHLLVINYLQ